MPSPSAKSRAHGNSFGSSMAGRGRTRERRAGRGSQAVEGARAQVTQAAAALAQAEVRRRELRIVAPISGVVLRKNLEVGETVIPGVPILTLIEPRDLWLRAYVPEVEVGRL